MAQLPTPTKYFTVFFEHETRCTCLKRMDLKGEYNNIYSLHENQIKNFYFLYWSWNCGPFKVKRNLRLSPSFCSVHSGLSLFCFESHSELSLFYDESILSSVHLGLSPCRCWVYSMLSPILSSVHSRFSPFGAETIWGWVYSGLRSFGIESIWGWVHSMFCAIRNWVHSDKSPILGSIVLSSVGESFEGLHSLRLWFRWSFPWNSWNTDVLYSI
jgi:hypothetical protein